MDEHVLDILALSNYLCLFFKTTRERHDRLAFYRLHALAATPLEFFISTLEIAAIHMSLRHNYGTPSAGGRRRNM